MATPVEDITSIGFQTFAKHWRRVVSGGVAQGEANSEVQHAYKSAKADGLDIEAMKLARKLKKMDALRVDHFFRNLLQMMEWLSQPIGGQLDLFASMEKPDEEEAREMSEFDAEQDGYNAGLAGAEIDACKFTAGTSQHVAWVKGHKNGAAFMAGKAGEQADRIADATQNARARGRGSRRGRGNGAGAAESVH